MPRASSRGDRAEGQGPVAHDKPVKPAAPAPEQGAALLATLATMGVSELQAAAWIQQYGESRVAAVTSWVKGRMKVELIHSPRALINGTLARNPK